MHVSCTTQHAFPIPYSSKKMWFILSHSLNDRHLEVSLRQAQNLLA